MEEEEEGVENILKELLPPGCLSPLPSTPPRPPSKKQKPSNDFLSPEVEKRPSPMPLTQIPLDSTLPSPVESTYNQVIDARYTGKVPYPLIPIDVPKTIVPRGRDPRLEGVLLKKTH